MQINEVSGVIYRAFDLINAQSVREFSVPPCTFIGAGAVARCGEAMADRSLKRVFVMVDGFLHQQGLDEGLYRSLSSANIEYEIAIYEGGEPNSNTVEAAGKQLLSACCDSVLAFGGGSVLDAAKVTAILAANAELTTRDLLDSSRTLQKRLPLIAIPTTAGTGSEATNVAVITDSTEHIKQVLVHPYLIPDLAIIDACLTLAVPSHITAITGIDALTHAVEAYVACHVTPLTRGFAYQAITLIGEALPHAVGQGSNIQARESMMLASYMAGMAFSNAGLGLCHAMAHQVGAKYNIPHGMANAIMLPSVMNFNQLVCNKEFAAIGYALTGKQIGAEETIQTIQQLIFNLGLCQKLQDFGGHKDDFPTLAEAALQDSCLKTNPRTATVEQIISVYQDALTF